MLHVKLTRRDTGWSQCPQTEFVATRKRSVKLDGQTASYQVI